MQIDVVEWRGLLALNVRRLSDFIDSTMILTPERLAQVEAHCDRFKTLARAWAAAGAGMAPQQAAGPAPEPHNAAAADPVPQSPLRKPHRRTGRPRGRPPGRRNSKTVADIESGQPSH